MIKNLRNLRDGELTRKNIEFDQLQNLLITYVFSLFLMINVWIEYFHRTKDSRIDDIVDLYVQIVLKQGQVEIESKPADLPPDQYRNTDVELIHRREVEDLNKSIIVYFLHKLFIYSSILHLLLGISKFQSSSNGKIERCY
jgi:hypothetical protein